MKFRYIGDKENMHVFGYDFRDGKEPDVTDANAIKRLTGNSHFEAIPDPVAPGVFVADIIAAAQAAIVEGADPLPLIVVRKKPGRKPKQ